MPFSVMTKEQFVYGLELNSSINKLHLICRHDAGGYNHIVCRIAHGFLKAYHTNNNNLTELSIHYADLQNGGYDIIVETLKICNHIDLYCCNIPDQQLLRIIEAVREHPSLEKLDLQSNNIGNAGF